MKQRLWWLLLPLGVAGLDLGSKALLVSSLHYGEIRTVIPGFFNLTYTLNTGAIFGTFQGAPAWLRLTLFTAAGLLALAYFGREFLRAETPRIQRIALGGILGGALGNGTDRLVRHAVVDFLDFHYAGWHYWTFNLADSAIVCGAIVLGWSLLTRREPA